MRAASAARSAHVTMMNLALLPDWDSLDSVRLAHSILEASGLVFFALLVVADAISHTSESDRKKHAFDTVGIWFFAIAVMCEIVGFQYSQRNDELSDQVIRSLDDVAKDASKKSAGAVTTSGNALTQAGIATHTSTKAEGSAARALDDAKGARSEANSVRTDLTLTEEEIRLLGPRYGLFVGTPRDEFRAAMKPFVGQKLLILTRSNAGVEERQLALLLEVMLHSPVRPSWDVRTDNRADFLSPEVMLGVSTGKATESTLKAAGALAKGLGAIGITDINGGNPLRIENFPELPPDTVELMIGEHIPIIKRALDGSSK